MGHVQAFDLKKLINDHNLSGYIETGTGIGDSLGHALQFPEFKKLYSVELDKELYDRAKVKFQDLRLTIFNKYSREALPTILNCLEADENYLFFLDAHFPGADFSSGENRYVESMQKYGADAIPLERELRTIKEMRPKYRDVIIVDDVWVYEEGPFEGGNWSEKPKLNIGNMDFVRKELETCFDISKIYKQQGYLILTPKEILCQ